MRIKILFVLMIATLFVMTACMPGSDNVGLLEAKKTETVDILDNEPEQTTNADNNGKADETYYISTNASMMKLPSSVEELYQQSEFVVTGEVIAYEVIFQNDTMYTLQQFAVESVYKGDMEAQSQILIVEMGGTTTFGEYDRNTIKTVKDFETGAPRRDANTIVIEGVNGHFPMAEGSEMLLFLVDTSGFIKNIDEKLYSVIGTYAGKLYKTDEQTYRQAAPSSNAEISFEPDSLSITLNEVQNCSREYTE